MTRIGRGRRRNSGRRKRRRIRRTKSRTRNRGEGVGEDRRRTRRKSRRRKKKKISMRRTAEQRTRRWRRRRGKLAANTINISASSGEYFSASISLSFHLPVSEPAFELRPPATIAERRRFDVCGPYLLISETPINRPYCAVVRSSA